MLVCVSAYITISYLTDNNKTKELFLSRKTSILVEKRMSALFADSRRRHKYLKIYEHALE